MAIDKKVIYGILIFFLIIGGIVYLNRAKFANGGVNSVEPSGSSKYDGFAKCLADKGVKMYGSFWCSHCKNQKAAFGSSFQYVNYTECTINGDQSSFSQVCKDANIKGYPTWKFPDGTIREGEVAFSDLAQLSGCTLPK